MEIDIHMRDLFFRKEGDTYYLCGTHGGKLYLFFCHEWTQIGDGTVCVAERDEKMQITDEVTTLYAASEAPWVLPHDGRNYVTDGPFLYRLEDGRPMMAWSSFGDCGLYIVGKRR